MPLSTTPSDSQAMTDLTSAYRRVRDFSETIAAPLTPEDCVVQSMPDVSPTRWHLAHTTWFFETFLLKQLDGYRVYDDDFDYLFNSYYNTVGKQFPRAQRGLLSRPTVDEVHEYRRHVDDAMVSWLQSAELSPRELLVLETGLNHEQQHQELMLTDIKHVLSCNPIFPIYVEGAFDRSEPIGQTHRHIGEGLYEIGHAGEGFAYDNESPRHRTFLEEFSVCERIVTAGEYLEFMAEGGYRQPEWWLSAGWHAVNEHNWQSPLYWHLQDREWFQFTLSGLQPIDHDAPVCHVSYFEADAYARWAGMRLPTEAEWEIASSEDSIEVDSADDLLSAGAAMHPQRQRQRSMFAHVWQWTSSPYVAYPGYAPADGALGEYNGKFMCGQYVLRGGSCATPSGHLRRTYRNFFPPDARWQFTGIRTATP